MTTEHAPAPVPGVRSRPASETGAAGHAASRSPAREDEDLPAGAIHQFDALDWKGRAVSCEGCTHRDLAEAGRCAPTKACVFDRYALRIDRFFRWNAALAKKYLNHPYFEVRAVAAKYVELFYLPRLLDDPDETVRWSVVQRLPQRLLLMVRQDPDREVRIRVANRLHVEALPTMIGDPDYYVRTVVARRIAPGKLPLMMHDRDREVRIEVARRIGLEHLPAMIADREPAVRRVAAQRLPRGHLLPLREDDDCLVRYEVAQRIDRAHLGPLLTDDDDLVREAARARQHGRVA